TARAARRSWSGSSWWSCGTTRATPSWPPSTGARASSAGAWRATRRPPGLPPIPVVQGERTQVVVSGTNRIRGYDPESGAVLWQCGGLSSNVVCTPVSAGGLLLAGSSYESQALLAIDLARAHGEITDSEAVLWTRRRATPYVPSLLLLDDSLYFLHHY